MTLGAFIVTCNGAALIPPVVRCLQQFADRVLVCVDSRSTDNTADVAWQLGAGVIAHQFKTGSYEDALNVCVGKLDTDWIFYIHDDELVGPAFIDALPGMMALRTGWRFPHYNLWPDEGHHIVSAPYFPDAQLRLVPRKMWLDRGGWPERVHSSPAWPCHFADVGIFHYKFLVKSEALRAERMRAWEAEWGPASEDHYRAFSIVEGRQVQTAIVQEPWPLQQFEVGHAVTNLA